MGTASYTDEFKVEAVKQVTVCGLPSRTGLRRWRGDDEPMAALGEEPRSGLLAADDGNRCEPRLP